MLVGVVLDRALLPPVLAERLVGRDPELGQESLHNAEEGHLREVPALHQLQEALRAQGGPVRPDLD